MNTLREMTHFPCRRNCCCSLPFLVACLLLSKNKSPYDVKSFPCPSFLPDQNYHKHTDIYSDTNTNLRVILKVLRNIVVIVVVGIVVLKLVGCNINTKLLLLLSFQSQGNISFFLYFIQQQQHENIVEGNKTERKNLLTTHSFMLLLAPLVVESSYDLFLLLLVRTHTHTDNKEGNFWKILYALLLYVSTSLFVVAASDYVFLI